MSLMIFTNGTTYYGKYYHEIRKMLAPDSMASNKILGTTMTWDVLITYLIKANAGLFALSSFFILGNQRTLGAITLIFAVGMVLATKDNPFMQSNLKSIYRESEQRSLDFIKHLSALGAALLLLVGDTLQ
jgi:hypothetical protein